MNSFIIFAWSLVRYQSDSASTEIEPVFLLRVVEGLPDHDSHRGEYHEEKEPHHHSYNVDPVGL